MELVGIYHSIQINVFFFLNAFQVYFMFLSLPGGCREHGVLFCNLDAGEKQSQFGNKRYLIELAFVLTDVLYSTLSVKNKMFQ